MIRSSQQLEFLQRVAQTLDESHQAMLLNAAEILGSKLRIAASKLDSVIGKHQTTETGTNPTSGSSSTKGEVVTKTKKVSYAMHKQSIDNAIEDIENWQRITDPSWFLILRIADSEIDKQLSATNMTDSLDTSTKAIRDSFRRSSIYEKQEVAIFRSEDELLSAVIENIDFCEAKIAHRRSSRTESSGSSRTSAGYCAGRQSRHAGSPTLSGGGSVSLRDT